MRAKSVVARRAAVKSYVAAVILIIAAVISLYTLPTEIKNPIQAGLFPLQRFTTLALAGLAVLNAMLGCIFLLYSNWLSTQSSNGRD